MNRYGEWYISWAERRSEPVQFLLAMITLFVVLGIVAPLVDLVQWVRSRLRANREGKA